VGDILLLDEHSEVSTSSKLYQKLVYKQLGVWSCSLEPESHRVAGIKRCSLCGQYFTRWAVV
jgi:hypothetical protein